MSVPHIPALVFAWPSQLPGWLLLMLHCSFYASVLALLVLAVQPVLRRWVPARYRFVLWLIVVLRFVPLPLPESRWSFFNLLPRQVVSELIANESNASAVKTGDVRPSAESRLEMIASPIAPVELAIGDLPLPSTELPPLAARAPDAHAIPPSAESVPAAPSTPTPGFQWLAWIYLLGATGIFFRLLVSTLSLRQILNRAQRVTHPVALAKLQNAQKIFGIRSRIPLLSSEDLSSPALVGLVRPRLLLPAEVIGELSADELQLVFLHECAHHKRRDVLLNYVLAALSIVHWFNPLFWLLLPRIRAERELATDELVLLRTSDPASYGHTLLKLLQSAGARPLPARKRIPAAVGIVETSRKSFLARRIHMIARFRNTPRWLAIPFAIALAVAAACSLTVPLTEMAQAAAPQGVTAASAVTAPPMPPKSAPAKAEAVTRATDVLDARPAPKSPLEERIKEISTEDTSLVKTLGFLRDNTNTNIIVNWGALNTLGIDKETRVSVNLKDVPLRKVLHVVLDLAAGSSGKLDFELEDGVIMVSTTEDFDNKTMVAAGLAQNAAAQAAALQAIKGQVTGLIPRTSEVDTKRSAESDPMLQQLLATRLNLEQEKAALMANKTADQGSQAQLQARMDKVDDQIASLRAKLEQEAKAHADHQAVKTPQTQIHMHDVREIAGIPGNTDTLTADQRASVDELVKTLSRLLDPSDAVSSFNGMLIISAPNSEQDRAAAILDEIRVRERNRRDEAKAKQNAPAAK